MRRASTTDDDAPSLRRGHANLLCIVFRLSNVTSEDVTLSIPQHTIKMSMVTSTTSHLWVTFDRPLPPPATPTDRQMDARDVDWACVAVDDEDEGDGIVLYHRSVEDPRSIVRRVVARGGGSTTSSSSSSSSVVCRAWKCATCLDVRRRTRASSSATRMGTCDGCDGDGDDDERGMTCRLDVTSVTRIDANGVRVDASRVFETDATTTTATRRWSLPRLEPMVAAFGRRAPSGEGEVTLIAVGGAAVASCSAGRASGGGRDAARSVFSAFRALDRRRWAS